MQIIIRGRHPSQAQLMMAVSCIFPLILDMMYMYFLYSDYIVMYILCFLLTSNM